MKIPWASIYFNISIFVFNWCRFINYNAMYVNSYCKICMGFKKKLVFYLSSLFIHFTIYILGWIPLNWHIRQFWHLLYSVIRSENLQLLCLQFVLAKCQNYSFKRNNVSVFNTILIVLSWSWTNIFPFYLFIWAIYW